MQCPTLTEEQVAYLAEQISGCDDLIDGLLSFIAHEVRGQYVSIETLARDLGKSRTTASKVFFLLMGMMLIDYTFEGMPRTYQAILNENGRRVVKALLKDETNPHGVLEIASEGVRKVERT